MSDPTPTGKKSTSRSRACKLTLSDSAVAVDDSRDRVLLALEINQLKTKIALRHYTLNARQCPLLNLPPELLVKIGEFVLEPCDTRSVSCFARDLFPLLQTCSQLRTQLQPLRSTAVTYFARTDDPWSGVTQFVKEWPWRLEGFHKGPATIIIKPIMPPYGRKLKPSTTADLAEAIEHAIYGHLSSPPAVYIGLNMRFGDTWIQKDRMLYVSHRRAEEMLVARYSCYPLEHLSPSSRVSREDGLEIWEQARKKTGDEAP